MTRKRLFVSRTISVRTRLKLRVVAVRRPISRRVRKMDSAQITRSSTKREILSTTKKTLRFYRDELSPEHASAAPRPPEIDYASFLTRHVRAYSDRRQYRTESFRRHFVQGIRFGKARVSFLGKWGRGGKPHTRTHTIPSCRFERFKTVTFIVNLFSSV